MRKVQHLTVYDGGLSGASAIGWSFKESHRMIAEVKARNHETTVAEDFKRVVDMCNEPFVHSFTIPSKEESQ